MVKLEGSPKDVEFAPVAQAVLDMWDKALFSRRIVVRVTVPWVRIPPSPFLPLGFQGVHGDLGFRSTKKSNNAATAAYRRGHARHGRGQG